MDMMIYLSCKIGGSERMALVIELINSKQTELNHKISNLERCWKVREFDDPAFFLDA